MTETVVQIGTPLAHESSGVVLYELSDGNGVTKGLYRTEREAQRDRKLGWTVHPAPANTATCERPMGRSRRLATASAISRHCVERRTGESYGLYRK